MWITVVYGEDGRVESAHYFSDNRADAERINKEFSTQIGKQTDCICVQNIIVVTSVIV